MQRQLEYTANVPQFPTGYPEILQRIERIDPVRYGRSRNFIDGAVTYLSPYISRGVISTRQVFQYVMARNIPLWKMEKFVQELAWRDYWQQIWIAKGDQINIDLKRPQPDVRNHGLAVGVTEAKTGITAIDDAINDFYKTGYLHNHVRMYIAAIACNIAKSHWEVPARWMYYHLLDADWASNALSWQWVAGSNSGKKYYANQQNINKYCYSKQGGTFLDVDYAEFSELAIPEVLKEIGSPKLVTTLPEATPISVDEKLPTCIYNFYNVDPNWKNDLEANRILLLEPSHFSDYPVSEKSIAFLLELAKNIPGIQIFVGEFQELMKLVNPDHCYYKEHPLNRHYNGVEEPRDWMFSVTGYYPSFFAFWKKCKKSMKPS